VKVLDFGLAKALEPGSASAPPALLTKSPTLTSPVGVTGIGVLLGTAAYMSPEQAKGLPADHRSDVFSFGVVLYEMLTGRQAFPGETLSEVLAAVLVREPDWSALPAQLHPQVVQLLKRCLEKQPRKRWQAMGDLRFELETLAAQPAVGVATPALTSRRPLWLRALPYAACAIAASLLTGGIARTMLRPPERPSIVARFLFRLPDGQVLTSRVRRSVAFSPDGLQMAYVANGQVWLRSVSELETRPIAGTEDISGGVSNPTFSPDGQYIAYWSDGTLKRIAVTGGSPFSICPVPLNPTGISWSEAGIFFGLGANGIMRVPANGGTPERVIAVDAGRIVGGPQLLPGGEWLLFTIAEDGRLRDGQLAVQSLASGERKILVDIGSDGRYLPTGHLVFARSGGVVLAVPLDLSRMAVVGEPVPVLEGVARGVGGLGGAGFLAAAFAVSASGSLVYVLNTNPALGGRIDLALLDRAGSLQLLKVPGSAYETPRVSPNGRQVALFSENNIWIYDLAGTSAMRQLTFGGTNRHPVWSPDSDRIAFQSDREGDGGIFWQRADGSNTPTRLTTPQKGRSHIPSSWSPDGSTLLYSEDDGSIFTLWAVSLSDLKSVPLGDVHSVVHPGAVFRPDGRWVAYRFMAQRDSMSEIFVQPFPTTGARYRVTSTGYNPMWSPDGRELFYGTGPGPTFQVVTVATQPTFTIGNPVSISRGSVGGVADFRWWDILPDGKRFVVVVDANNVRGIPDGAEFVVVVNWTEELKQRVPAR
jgi:serine/threonine-protein kinase